MINNNLPYHIQKLKIRFECHQKVTDLEEETTGIKYYWQNRSSLNNRQSNLNNSMYMGRLKLLLCKNNINMIS